MDQIRETKEIVFKKTDFSTIFLIFNFKKIAF